MKIKKIPTVDKKSKSKSKIKQYSIDSITYGIISENRGFCDKCALFTSRHTCNKHKHFNKLINKFGDCRVNNFYFTILNEKVEASGLYGVAKDEFKFVSEDTREKHSHNDKVKLCLDSLSIEQTPTVLICENCKRFWLAPKDQCVCGSKTLSKTHSSNIEFVKNYNQTFKK